MDDKPFEGRKSSTKTGKGPAIFLAIVGALWLIAMGWLLAVVIELTHPRPAIPVLVLIALGLMAGPFCMMSGSILTFGRKLGKTSTAMLYLGCFLFSALFLVFAFDALRRMHTPQAPPNFWPYAVLGLLAILADMSAWKLGKRAKAPAVEVSSPIQAKSADPVL